MKELKENLYSFNLIISLKSKNTFLKKLFFNHQIINIINIILFIKYVDETF